MTTIGNIPALLSGNGLTGLQSGGLEGAGGDMFGLLNLIFGQIEATSLQGDGALLQENIAEILQNLSPEQKQKVPDLLALLSPDINTEALTPDAAIQKITDLLGEKTATADTQSIRPSLLRDLSAHISASLAEFSSEKTNAPSITKESLEQFANDLKLIAEKQNNPALSKILNILQDPGSVTHARISDRANLEKIGGDTEEIHDILTSLAQKNPLSTSQSDIVHALKNEGYDTPDIEHHLRALTQKLTNHDNQIQKQPLLTTSQAANAAEQIAEDNMLLFAQKQSIEKTASQAKMDTTTPEDVVNQKQAVPLPGHDVVKPQPKGPQTTAPAHTALINALSADTHDGATGEQNLGQRSFMQQYTQTDAVGYSAKFGADNLQFHQLVQGNNRTLPAHVTDTISLQLQKNAQNKVNRMTLQLEPADLGRLDIEMTFGRDGQMKAHLTADKADTLAHLQKDAPQLMRALQDAGFKLEDNALSFDLRQDTAQHSHQDFQTEHGKQENSAGFEDAMNGDKAALAALENNAVYASGYISATGVNIVI